MDTVTKTTYIVRMNREPVSPDKAAVSIFDHGFLFGDSIFEVVRTVKGKILALNEHLRRLRNSAARVKMDLPWSNADLKSEIEAVIRDADWSGESYVRLIVSRGVGNIELLPDTCREPVLVVIGKALPVFPDECYTEGMTLCLTDVIRNSSLSMDPAIKSGNYLNNALAMIESREKGADDALMLNEHGYVTESSTSNFYFVKDGIVKTAALDCGILAGITRDILLKIAPEAGIPVKEGYFIVDDLLSADEAFMSGTIKGVMPVRAITGRIKWQAPPGPVTARLRREYESHVGLSD
jgi:branched-chain amino acid aminotransferase